MWEKFISSFLKGCGYGLSVVVTLIVIASIFEVIFESNHFHMVTALVFELAK